MAFLKTDDKEKVIEQLQKNTGIEISAREHQNILSLMAQQKLLAHHQERITSAVESEVTKSSQNLEYYHQH